MIPLMNDDAARMLAGYLIKIGGELRVPMWALQQVAGGKVALLHDTDIHTNEIVVRLAVKP